MIQNIKGHAGSLTLLRGQKSYFLLYLFQLFFFSTNNTLYIVHSGEQVLQIKHKLLKTGSKTDNSVKIQLQPVIISNYMYKISQTITQNYGCLQVVGSEKILLLFFAVLGLGGSPLIWPFSTQFPVQHQIITHFACVSYKVQVAALVLLRGSLIPFQTMVSNLEKSNFVITCWRFILHQTAGVSDLNYFFKNLSQETTTKKSGPLLMRECCILHSFF